MIKNHSFFQKKAFFKKILIKDILVMFSFFLFTAFSFYFLFNNAILDETMLYSWAWMINYFNKKLFFILLLSSFFVSVIFARINFKFKEKYFLVLLFVIAFVLSSFSWGFISPNPDSVEFYGVSKYIEINGLFNFIKDFGSEKLLGYRFHTFPILLGLLFRFLWESPFIVHFFASLFYSFIPVLIFLISKKYFNKQVAIISSFFFLSIPLLIVQSSMFLVDISTIFFVLLSFIVFEKFLLRKEKYWYLIFGLVLFLTLFSKRTSLLFLILPLFVIFFMIKKKNSFLDEKVLTYKSLIVTYALFVFSFILIFLKFSFFRNQFSLDLSQINIINNPVHYVGNISYLFQLPSLLIIFFVLFLGFFIFNPRLSNLFLLVWIIFPLFFIHGTNIRYFFPAIPALCIVGGIIISKLRKPIINFTICFLFTISVLLFFMAYSPLLENEYYDLNIKASANYLENLELDIDNVGVYLFYNNSVCTISPKSDIYPYNFDFYSNKRIYYYVSESLVKCLKNFEGHSVFDYYNNSNYLNPDFDSLVIFSDIKNFNFINDSDISLLSFSLSNYSLNKTFSLGQSGIEKTRFAFIYLKN